MIKINIIELAIGDTCNNTSEVSIFIILVDEIEYNA